MSTILSPIVTQVLKRIYGLFLTPVTVESTSFGFLRKRLEGEWGLPEVNDTGKADFRRHYGKRLIYYRLIFRLTK